MAVPQDEKAQLEVYLVRMQHLSTVANSLAIPDKGLKKRYIVFKLPPSFWAV